MYSSCLSGYIGDPFRGCQLEPVRIETTTPQPRNPCYPSPCGPNAVCNERNGGASCTCLPDYFGDPYSGCRPECVVNSDCATTKACVRSHCVEACTPHLCGYNADCSVRNHLASWLVILFQILLIYLRTRKLTYIYLFIILVFANKVSKEIRSEDAQKFVSIISPLRNDN